MFRVTLPLVAVLATCAVPAAAEEAWGLANRSYIQGTQSGVSPLTTGEMLSCGAYWSVWDAVLDGSGFADQELAELTPQLHPESALMVARAYISDIDQVPADRMKELEGYLSEASGLFDAYLDGDDEAGGTFFAMLGICHPRAGEGAVTEG